MVSADIVLYLKRFLNTPEHQNSLHFPIPRLSLCRVQ
jgi:hypothetical protein